jgi:hypothetical protein
MGHEQNPTSRRLEGAILLLGLMLLSACQPLTSTGTLPPPQTWRVQVPQELAWLGPDLNACAAQVSPDGHVGVLVSPPAGGTETPGADFSLEWDTGDPPAQAYRAVLGQMALAVIVNPQISLTELSVDQVQAAFGGQAADWAALAPKDCPACLQHKGPLQPLIYPDGDPVMLAFESLFQSLPARPLTATLAPDPQVVRAAVAGNPLALGFIPAAFVDSTVQVVKVSGLDPARLSFPIVLGAASQPEGIRLAWLLCLQDKLK